MESLAMKDVMDIQASELIEKAKTVEKIGDARVIDEPLAKLVTPSESRMEAFRANAAKYQEVGATAVSAERNEISTAVIAVENTTVDTKTGLHPLETIKMGGYEIIADGQGRQVEWRGKPQYTPENTRDNLAQLESGGEDRLRGDDGGHIVARTIGGSSGSENLVAMRDTINRGDYKKTENEITAALKEGKDVEDSGKIEYNGDSSRPSKIERDYRIDGEKTILKIDNEMGSIDLLREIGEKLPADESKRLENRIKDMEEDGGELSVTSYEEKYDSKGNLLSVEVRVREEITGERFSYVVDGHLNRR